MNSENHSLESLVNVNRDIINQLRAGLETIGQTAFVHKADEQTSSIGAHVRHLIEFYQEFLKAVRGESQNGLCYDHRQRDLALENDCGAALAALDDIKDLITGTVFEDQDLSISVTLNPPNANLSTLRTTIHRELYHVFDHSTHHMAIIKMLAKDRGIMLDEGFGLASSTNAHQHACGADQSE